MSDEGWVTNEKEVLEGWGVSEKDLQENKALPELEDDTTSIHGLTPLATKIYAISDIHSEFYTMHNIDKLLSILPKVNAKYCVLAGDIGNVTECPDKLRKVLQFFKERHKYVIYVPGNHEYYMCGYKKSAVDEKLITICAEEGVHLLNRGTVVLDGVLFIGATLWSAVDEEGFKGIGDSKHIFKNIVEYLEEFTTDYKFIKEELFKSIELDIPVVVVTHHLPSKRLIHSRYKDDPINKAFYTNLTDILPIHKVNYWFCGHTHEYNILRVLDTFFVCNPMGYPEEFRYTKLLTEPFEIKGSAF